MEQFTNQFHMSYESLKYLRHHHKAWKLLASTNAPFVISFLHKVFIEKRIREISEYEIIALLMSFIHDHLVESDKSPSMYLNDWSSEEYGLLRKYYPTEVDEIYYDLTPEGQNAIEWVHSLKQQSFIGNESRLISVFHLLNEIVAKTDHNPETRIVDLQNQKNKLDIQIQQIKDGYMEVLDETQIKERYMQVMRLSREIISDFRQVEQNFRNLERKMKEDIASWDKSKGDLLANFFLQEESIEQSQQGKSFDAFWRFLTSSSQHDEFDKLIQHSIQLESIQTIEGYENMLDVEYLWQKESRHVQATIAMISKQLKRYLDDDYLEEEKRISQLITSIEKLAIEIKDEPPKTSILEINTFQPKIQLPLERPLFTRPVQLKVINEAIEEGCFDEDDHLLFNQVHIDKQVLVDQIQAILEFQSSVTLPEILQIYPLEYGLGELLLYLQIANDEDYGTVSNLNYDSILWLDQDEQIRKTQIPNIIFKNREEL